MLKYLIEKEFKQFRRNPFLPKMVFIFPCLMMLILPWAADLGTKNVNLVVVDNDRTSYSSRLVNKAAASEYFNFTAAADSYATAMEYVELGEADIILEIPRHFERDLTRESNAGILISANTVNGTKGMLGSSYLSSIARSFSEELRESDGRACQAAAKNPVIEIVPRTLFNPSLDYKRHMVPAIMVILITLIGGFLPSLNIVGEKEAGTIEQINVTPVKKPVFILAKLIPYWLMGLGVLTLCLIIEWLVYGIVPSGSLFTIYSAFIIYVVALSGLGIVISNYSGTMQQAMFLMFFFLIIFILMSGVFTPVSSMPGWAQGITIVNPLRYFVEIMRSVFHKGSSILNLSTQFVALCVFAVTLNIWAVLSYKKHT